jgi:hypothetical protein
MLFVNHLGILILLSDYKIKQQYTDWYHNYGTQELFMTSIHLATE